MHFENLAALTLLMLTVGCGSAESSSTPAPAAETVEFKADITAAVPVYTEVGDAVYFQAAYSGTPSPNQLSVIILSMADTPPPRCTADYTFKYLFQSWKLSSGVVYTFRACLYDTDTGKFSEGFAGSFVAE